MKQKNYKVDSDKKVEWVIAFIRKYLKMEAGEQLVSLSWLHTGPHGPYCSSST